jgi:hypothetical protein
VASASFSNRLIALSSSISSTQITASIISGSQITGSLFGTASFAINAQAYSSSFSTSDTATSGAFTSTINTLTAAVGTNSSSLLAASSSLITLSGSVQALSASNQADISMTLVVSSSLLSVSSSFIVASASLSQRLVALSSSFNSTQITGSIISGSQITGSLFGTASFAINAQSYSSSLSISYTANSASFTTTINALSASAGAGLTNLVAASASFSNRLVALSGSFRSSQITASAFNFSGSATSSIRLEVLPDGSLVFIGAAGALFGISDSLSGSLSSINDVSGLPIFEVFSDDKVVMGKFGTNALVVSGSQVGVGKSPQSGVLDVSGSLILTGSLSVTQNITASIISGSQITGSLFGTASFATNAQTYSSSLSVTDTAVSAAFTVTINALSSSNTNISSSFVALSSSYVASSASFSTRIFVDSGSLLALSSSFQIASASFTVKELADSSSLLAVSSSYIASSASFSNRLVSLSSSFNSSQITASVITASNAILTALTSSGNNVFGTSLLNRHQFTGSVAVTGSIAVSGSVSATEVRVNGVSVAAIRNPLSPRTGVVFERTTAYLRSTLSGITIGTGDCSLSFVAKVPISPPDSNAGWGLYMGPSNVANAGASSLYTYLDTSGGLVVAKRNSADVFQNVGTISNFVSSNAGKVVHFSLVRTSGSWCGYIDAVPSFTSSVAVTESIDNTYLICNTIESVYGNFTLYCASLYNCALNSDAVREIFELGGEVPDRFKWADTGSNRIADSAKDSVFTSATTNWSGFGAGGSASVDFGAQELDVMAPTAGSGIRLSAGGTYTLLPHFKSYRIRATLRNVSGGTVSVVNTSGGIVQNTFGSGFGNGNIDIVGNNWTPGANNGLQLGFTLSASGSFSIDDIILTEVGALVHLPLNDNGGTIARDSSPNVYDAAAIGSPRWTDPRKYFIVGEVGNYTQISGSAITSSFASITQITGSVFGTSSWANRAVTASFAILPTNVVSSSAQLSNNGEVAFGSGNNVTFGQVTASVMNVGTLIVTTISSSVNYSSGSNRFGNSQANAHEFTGSVSITGSLTVTNGITGTASFATNAQTYSSSFATTVNALSASNQADIALSLGVSSSLLTVSASYVASSASFSTRTTNLVADSASFSGRTTTLEVASGSLSTRVTNLVADSASFSTRLVTLSSSLSTSDTANSASFTTTITALSASNQADIALSLSVSSSLLAVSSSFVVSSGSFSNRLVALSSSFGTSQLTAQNAVITAPSVSTLATAAVILGGSYGGAVVFNDGNYGNINVRNIGTTMDFSVSQSLSSTFTTGGNALRLGLVSSLFPSGTPSTSATVAALVVSGGFSTGLNVTVGTSVTASSANIPQVTGSLFGTASFATNALAYSSSFSTSNTSTSASFNTTISTLSSSISSRLPPNIVSSSAQLSNGGGIPFNSTNNITLGQITASIISGSQVTGSFFGTASFAQNAQTYSSSFSTSNTTDSASFTSTINALSASAGIGLTNLIVSSASFSNRLVALSSSFNSTQITGSFINVGQLTSSFGNLGKITASGVNIVSGPLSFNNGQTMFSSSGTQLSYYALGAGTGSRVLFDSSGTWMGIIRISRVSNGAMSDVIQGSLMDGSTDGMALSYQGGNQASIEIGSDLIRFNTLTATTPRATITSTGASFIVPITSSFINSTQITGSLYGTASFVAISGLPANLVSSSAQLSNGGGVAFTSANNLTVGQITGSSVTLSGTITGSTLYLSSGLISLVGGNSQIISTGNLFLDSAVGADVTLRSPSARKIIFQPGGGSPVGLVDANGLQITGSAIISSNTFHGTSLANVHQFSGSVSISSSLNVLSNFTASLATISTQLTSSAIQVGSGHIDIGSNTLGQSLGNTFSYGGNTFRNYGQTWYSDTPLGGTTLGISSFWGIRLFTNQIPQITISGSGTVSISGSVGIGTSNPAYKLEVNGSFAATSKSFVIKHPTKPNKKLQHGVVEGPEHSVYIRGRLDGKEIIEFPEYWSKLVDFSTITVQLTPIGYYQKLIVKKIDKTGILVENTNLINKYVECFYYVQAERVDIPKMEVEV